MALRRFPEYAETLSAGEGARDLLAPSRRRRTCRPGLSTELTWNCRPHRRPTKPPSGSTARSRRHAVAEPCFRCSPIPDTSGSVSKPSSRRIARARSSSPGTCWAPSARSFPDGSRTWRRPVPSDLRRRGHPVRPAADESSAVLTVRLVAFSETGGVHGIATNTTADARASATQQFDRSRTRATNVIERLRPAEGSGTSTDRGSGTTAE